MISPLANDPRSPGGPRVSGVPGTRVYPGIQVCLGAQIREGVTYTRTTCRHIRAPWARYRASWGPAPASSLDFPIGVGFVFLSFWFRFGVWHRGIAAKPRRSKASRGVRQGRCLPVRAPTTSKLRYQGLAVFQVSFDFVLGPRSRGGGPRGASGRTSPVQNRRFWTGPGPDH